MGDKDNAKRIFGWSDKNSASVGSIIVFDALPVDSVKLYTEVMTPHDGGWRIAPKPTESDAPSDWKSPTPIPFLAVEKGATFQFALAARPGAKSDDLEKAYEYLDLALEWIGIGAKTAVGFGRFKSKEAMKAEQVLNDLNKPPEVGDIVEIIEGDFKGRSGEIIRVFSYGSGMAQLKPNDGEGKIKGTIPFTSLKRILITR